MAVAIMERLSEAGVSSPGWHMLLNRVKVETTNVEQGMYVSQLDRPWLETPFFFQAFEVSKDDEIALLRKFCKHVYVDATRSAIGKKKVLQAHKLATSKVSNDPFSDLKKRSSSRRRVTLSRRLVSALSYLDPTGKLASLLSGKKQYRNTVSTRKEAPQAIAAYKIAVKGVDRFLTDIRNGGGVNVDKVKKVVGPMIESVLRNQDAMSWLVLLRKRGGYAQNHSIATSVWAVILGRHLGFDRHALDTLAIGALLLDIGKTKIPESLTMKEETLTDEEKAILRVHVDYGVEIANVIPGLGDDVIAMIQTHHERHDGSGYPAKLSGMDIPVFGRIAGLADCYDAMTTNRAYAPAMSAYDAIRELNLSAGMQFQREMVEQFVQALGMFPTGSLVEINTGEVGIVIEQNRVRRLRPQLMLLLDADKEPLKSHKTMNLRKLPEDAGNPKARWITQGFEAGAFGIDPKDYFM